LIKVALMHKDLEFEYPHKLEKIKVKNDILMWLDEEEEKLRQQVFQLEKDANKKNDRIDNLMTYDKYYTYDPALQAPNPGARQRRDFGSSKKDSNTTYEEFLAVNESANIFDNDLLEQEYKFWENEFDKEERLKTIWINYKRSSAQGGLDAKTSEEQIELNNKIAELVRKIRWRVDQELTKRSIDPLFKENYYSFDREEFLIDADMEFYKVKKLLNKNPRVLREDPLLSLDYLRIISLIKKKKLMEATSNHYDVEDSLESVWLDADATQNMLDSKA